MGPAAVGLGAGQRVGGEVIGTFFVTIRVADPFRERYANLVVQQRRIDR